MMMKHYYDTFSTPAGDFSVAIDTDGALVATAFGGLSELRTRFAAGELVRDTGRTAAVRAEVTEYFDGGRTRFSVAMAPRGSAFQQQVWSALRRIPFGRTVSYGELAREIGQPSAARAIGRANATNPICLLVPCHRVIGADGSLIGFAFGEDIKRRLLEHEGAVLPV
jgi:methylated-DNA-[protein]-cysteine S-methyltransferase